MTTLKISNSPLDGLDLVFDEKKGQFVMDESLNSNLLVSIFFEKRVVETSIQAIQGVGGWAGNNSLPEADILGSTVWYEIRNRRLSENTKILVKDAIYKALDWTISEGYVDDLLVSVSSEKRTGKLLIQIQYIESISRQRQRLEVPM